MHLPFLLPALVAGSAIAQPDSGPSPADPKASVPRIEYRSAFADYRPAGEATVTPWRESNEAVKEAEGRAQKPPEKEKAAAKTNEHGGHK